MKPRPRVTNQKLTSMFSLVMGCWEHYFRKVDYKALVVGLDDGGKTVRDRMVLAR